MDGGGIRQVGVRQLHTHRHTHHSAQWGGQTAPHAPPRATSPPTAVTRLARTAATRTRRDAEPIKDDQGSTGTATGTGRGMTAAAAMTGEGGGGRDHPCTSAGGERDGDGGATRATRTINHGCRAVACAGRVFDDVRSGTGRSAIGGASERYGAKKEAVLGARRSLTPARRPPMNVSYTSRSPTPSRSVFTLLGPCRAHRNILPAPSLLNSLFFAAGR